MVDKKEAVAEIRAGSAFYNAEENLNCGDYASDFFQIRLVGLQKTV